MIYEGSLVFRLSQKQKMKSMKLLSKKEFLKIIFRV